MTKTTGTTPAEGTGVIRKKVWLYVIGILLVGLLVALPHIASAYAASVIFILLVYVGYAEGWNIMSGLTGYVNFGYSLFAGIAGYTSVILIIDYGLWWPIAWVIGGISASIVAFMLGMVMLRLRGSYFAIGMLALLLGIQLLLYEQIPLPDNERWLRISFYRTHEFHCDVLLRICDRASEHIYDL